MEPEKKHEDSEDVELRGIDIEGETSPETSHSEPSIEPTPIESEHKVGLMPTRKPWYKRMVATKKRKIITSIVAIVVILGALYAVPTTRYGILGTILKKNVSVMITDVSTHKPVTSATVTLAGKSVTTNETGEADFSSVPVGEYTVSVTKKYYKDSSFTYTVPIFSNPQQASTTLMATGRQVTVSVVNIITKAALARASITVSGTTALTDDKGMATLVLPADKTSLDGTLRLSGYNDAKVSIIVTDQANKNNFALTPTGTIYYLSNASGTINVMKSNLDGTNAQVAVKGTGDENPNATTLLASRDWKYLALVAHRTNDSTDQLYVYNTQTGALTLMDQSPNADTNFSPIGWSDHRFIYESSQFNVPQWQSGRQALKSYDADSAKLTTIDQTAAGGTADYNAAYEQITSPYIVGNKIFYGKSWWGNPSTYTSFSPLKQTAAIMSINADGSQMTRLKEFPLISSSGIDVKLYKPQSLYFRVVTDNNQPTYYSYANGSLTPTSINDATFYNTPYPTYLVSPSSNKTFWQELRDGKNTLFVGDASGDNATTIASQSDYATYGWFGDDYILLSKNGSELYIASAKTPLSDTTQPLKITNYFKPQYSYPGYGYGYGGL